MKTLKEVFSGLGGPNKVEQMFLQACEKNLHGFVRNVVSTTIEDPKGINPSTENTGGSSSIENKQYPRRDITEVYPKLRQSCRLFCDFESGILLNLDFNEDELQNILAGIAYSLIQVNGGADYFLSIIYQFNYPTTRNCSWEAQVAYFKRTYAFPQGCDKFCPNSVFCNHSTNMLLTAK